MKSTKILFKDLGENIADTVFAKTFMNRAAVKKRIENTRLSRLILPLSIAKWLDTDNGSTIKWKFTDTPLGEVLVASTDKGICFMGFVTGDYDLVFADLKSRFPLNVFQEGTTSFHTEAIKYLADPEEAVVPPMHLKGSEFQISIWEKLLKLPFGALTTYSALAGAASHARAVGSAVGANPICYILPCHRVVRTDGTFDGFYWGTELKRKLLVYEAATSIAEIFENGFSGIPKITKYQHN